MKRVLIVFAYPNHSGLNYEIYKRVKAGHEDRNHQVQTLDLYAEGFDPVLRFDQTDKRRDMKDRVAMKPYREQILWADHLIFIFPIWWGSMPAIMKGYFDQVFATGFAYHFEGVFPKGHLKGKSASIITSDDTPTLFRLVAMRDYGNVLKNQILRIMTGVRVKRHIRFSYVKGRNPATIERWLKRCYRLS